VVEGFENLATRYLGAFQFVGKTEATPIYEVMALRERATDEQLALRDAFKGAMLHYEQGDWQSSAEELENVLVEFPDDGPAKFLLARCRRFISDPESAPEPGVIRMDAK
jgi:adenylate cyclase